MKSSAFTAGLLSAAFSPLATADDPPSLDLVEVRARKIMQGLLNPEDSPKARSSVTQTAIEQRNSLSIPFKDSTCCPAQHL